jgi:MoaA/NifB/PqqE/SkfB family radical SAM enzyme
MNSSDLFRIVHNTTKLFCSGKLSIKQKFHLVKFAFVTKILRRDCVRSVEIVHTLKCNCHCAFCSNDKLTERNGLLTNDDIYSTIDRVVEYGVAGLIFIGGETMTDKNLPDYIRYVRKKGAIPLLCTNGTLLTAESIRELAGAGLYSVTITVHDALSEEHDRIVGKKGAMETIRNAVPLLKQYGIEISLKTIYSRQSVESGAFGRILAMAKNLNVGLNVNPIMPVGKGFSPDNLLSDEEKVRYHDVCSRERIITTHSKASYDSQCPAGHNYLCIMSDGEIMPCYFLPVSVGNIKEISVAEAQKRAINMGIFKNGADSCIVAMDRKFFETVIKELYSGKYTLPVRITESEECAGLFTKYLG